MKIRDTQWHNLYLHLFDLETTDSDEADIIRIKLPKKSCDSASEPTEDNSTTTKLSNAEKLEQQKREFDPNAFMKEERDRLLKVWY